MMFRLPPPFVVKSHGQVHSSYGAHAPGHVKVAPWFLPYAGACRGWLRHTRWGLRLTLFGLARWMLRCNWAETRVIQRPGHNPHDPCANT